MVDVPEGVQIASIYAGLATTVIVVIGGPLIGVYVANQNGKRDRQAAETAAKVAEVAEIAAVTARANRLKLEEVKNAVVNVTEVGNKKLDVLVAQAEEVKYAVGNGVVAKLDNLAEKNEAILANVGELTNRVTTGLGPNTELLATAEKVAEVRHAVGEVKTVVDANAKVSDDSHVLLNSGHGVLLASLATAQRALTKLDPSPGNIEKLAAADKQLAEHEASQKIVDEGKKIEARP